MKIAMLLVYHYKFQSFDINYQNWTDKMHSREIFHDNCDVVSVLITSINNTYHYKFQSYKSSKLHLVSTSDRPSAFETYFLRKLLCC